MSVDAEMLADNLVEVVFTDSENEARLVRRSAATVAPTAAAQQGPLHVGHVASSDSPATPVTPTVASL